MITLYISVVILIFILWWVTHCFRVAGHDNELMYVKIRYLQTTFFIERVANKDGPTNTIICELVDEFLNTSLNKHAFYLMSFQEPWEFYSDNFQEMIYCEDLYQFINEKVEEYEKENS